MYHVELVSFPQWVQTNVLDVHQKNLTDMKKAIHAAVVTVISHFFSFIVITELILVNTCLKSYEFGR